MSAELRGVRADRVTAMAMLVLCSVAGASRVMAQSNSAVSLQASGMAISSSNLGEGSNAGTRFGIEGQVRYNPPGKFSIGVGFEQSTVFKSTTVDLSARLQSFFVEPRYVVTALGANAALYVAARLSNGTLSCSGAGCLGAASESHGGAGGGAGVLVRLGGRAGLDIGAQYYTFFPSDSDGGNTPHFLFFRAGLSFGL